MRTTADLFQKQLHVYTITHAIEDGNVLRFHIDYFKPEGKNPPKPDEAIAKQSVIESILANHDSSTNQRRFNAILATASINDAIEYHAPFKTMQAEKQSPKMTREELISLISADAKFMDERDDIAEYIGTLKAGEGLSETAIREGYNRFKADKNAKELAAIATKHGLTPLALQSFVDGILDPMIFDGEHLSYLLSPLDLGWKARTHAELALMADLCPLLTKRAGGRDVSGLSGYEE